MFDFLDSAISQHAIGAIHAAIATLRQTYGEPSSLEQPIYDAILKAIERGGGIPIGEISYKLRQGYITQLEWKQRQLSGRTVDVDGVLGRRLLDTMRTQHEDP